MTQAEVKVFDSDLVLFPVPIQASEAAAEIENKEVVETKIRTLKNDLNQRFSRLRKNMRKRSASIF